LDSLSTLLTVTVIDALIQAMLDLTQFYTPKRSNDRDIFAQYNLLPA